jgi:hypothetical protein
MNNLATALTVAVLALGAVGCGGEAEEASDDVASEIETAAPETEDTESTEEGENGGSGAVAVELPGLPIGGPSTVVSDTLQCAEVTWSGPPDLPQGWGITVTGVGFDPAGDFAVTGDDCPGDSPPCLASGVQLTSDGGCHVAVTWTAPNTDGGQMSFTSGTAICPPGAAEACQGFRDDVEGEGLQTIPLEPAPVIDGEGTDGEGTESEGTEEEGTEGEESGGTEEGSGTEDANPDGSAPDESGESGSTGDGGG